MLECVPIWIRVYVLFRARANELFEFNRFRDNNVDDCSDFTFLHFFFNVDLWKSGLNNQYVYHLNLDISEEMIVGNNDGMHVIMRLIT